MCAYMNSHVPHPCRYPWRPKEDIRFTGTGVTDSSKSPEMDSKNQIQVLCKKLFNG